LNEEENGNNVINSKVIEKNEKDDYNNIITRKTTII